MSSRRLVLNASAMLALGVAQRAMGLVATTFLARILTVGQLGAYACTQSSSQTFYGFLRLGADAGMHVLLAKLDPKAQAEAMQQLVGQGLSLFLLIASAGAAAMVVLAEPLAGRLFAAPQLADFIRLAAIVFAGQTLAQFSYVVFAGFHAFSTYSRITMATTVATVAACVFGAWRDGAWGAATGLAAGQVLTALCLAVGSATMAARRGVRLRPRWPGRGAAAILKLGLPFYGAGLLVIPADFLVMGFVTRIHGVETLGELRVVLAVIALASLMPQSLAGPMVSHLAEAHAQDPARRQQALLMQVKAVWLLALASATALAVAWPFVVRLIFGDAYVRAETLGPLALLALAPTMIGAALTGALMAWEKTLALFSVGAAQALVLIGAAWWLAPQGGLSGYFGAQAIASLSAMTGWALFLRRYAGEPLLRSWMAPLAIMTVLFAGLVLLGVLVPVSLPLRLGVGAAVAGLFALTSWCVVLSNGERDTLVRAVSAGRRRLTGLAAPAPGQSGPRAE